MPVPNSHAGHAHTSQPFNFSWYTFLHCKKLAIRIEMEWNKKANKKKMQKKLEKQ